MTRDLGQTPRQSIEEQLVDLQTRLAYQEDAIDGLNRIVTDQRAEIEGLQKQVKLLKAQWLEAGAEPTHIEEAFAKPPHY